jgi:hypothetical protein
MKFKGQNMLEISNARWHSPAYTPNASCLLARAVLHSSVPFNLQVHPCQTIEIDAFCSALQSPAYLLVELSETQLGELTSLCWFLIKLESSGYIDMNCSGIADSEEVLLEYGFEHETYFEEGM